MDRSTCPYHRSRISPQPQHRHGPPAVPKAFPREYQVDNEDHLQSRDTDRKIVATPYEIFPNTRFTSRDATAIGNSRLVTGLVTVNGNSKRSWALLTYLLEWGRMYE